MHATCPADPRHDRFRTVVHIAEQWIVNRAGDPADAIEAEPIEVTHGPDPDNRWECLECGADAVVRR